MNKFFKKVEIISLIIVCIVIFFFVRINNVTISGDTRYTAKMFEEKIFDTDFDRFTLYFMIKNIIHKKKLPCIESYKIEYITPFSINAEIIDKKPIAFVKKDIYNVMLDSDGNVCEILENKEVDAVEIRGINFESNILTKRLGATNISNYDNVIESINCLNELGLKCDIIAVNNKNEISIFIDKIEAVIGDDKNLSVKLRRLSDIYPKIANLSGVLDLTNAKEKMDDEKYIFRKQSITK